MFDVRQRDAFDSKESLMNFPTSFYLETFRHKFLEFIKFYTQNNINRLDKLKLFPSKSKGLICIDKTKHLIIDTQ